MKTTYTRHDDTMAIITIEAHSAIIQWQEVLDCIKVEPDDYPETPWQHCDGYQHRLVLTDGPEEDGFASFIHERRWQKIEMQYDTDLFNWYRERGASKQVADQLTRQSMRKRIEQLIDWYRNGWEWWQVRGEMHGCYASVGGVDDFNYANSLCRVEVALELAHELEATGYEVTGKPAPESTTEHYSQLNLFNIS